MQFNFKCKSLKFTVILEHMLGRNEDLNPAVEGDHLQKIQEYDKREATDTKSEPFKMKNLNLSFIIATLSLSFTEISWTILQVVIQIVQIIQIP